MVYPSMYPVTSTRFNQTAYYNPQGFVQQQHPHPNSPDSFSSSTSSPPTPPSSTSTAKLGHVSTITMHPSSSTSTTSSSSSSSSSSSITTPSLPYANNHIITSQAIDSNTTPPPIINPLVASSSTFSNATTARVKETIARANSIPMEFYHTEFLEYSKETYERKMDAKRNKRKRPSQQQDQVHESLSLDAIGMTKQANSKRTKKQQHDTMNDSDDDFDADDLENMTDA